MVTREQQAKAECLRCMHQSPPILILPNAWDAISARLFEEAGFPAVATTSAGLAAALGYPDGEYVPREELFAAVRRITRITHVPVTVDLVAGFGATVAEVVETVQGIIAAGGVGINLEDATGRTEAPLFSIAQQEEKIRAIRAAATAMDLPLVINARTDVYHVLETDAETRFAQAVERVNRYRAAGADCLFIPFVSEAATIARLAKAVNGPLNILATVGTPSVFALEAMGVARVSVGAGPCRATLGLVQRIATHLRDTGTYSSFLEGAMAYADVNRLLTPPNDSLASL